MLTKQSLRGLAIASSLPMTKSANFLICNQIVIIFSSHIMKHFYFPLRKQLLIFDGALLHIIQSFGKGIVKSDRYFSACLDGNRAAFSPLQTPDKCADGIMLACTWRLSRKTEYFSRTVAFGRFYPSFHFPALSVFRTQPQPAHKVFDAWKTAHIVTRFPK
jgi:hypothetical protein